MSDAHKDRTDHTDYAGHTDHTGHTEYAGHPDYPGHANHQPPTGGWEPVPQGEGYDGDATAFVQLPPEFMLEGTPLEAPGHGYVPPMITPLTPLAPLTPTTPLTPFTTPDQAGDPMATGSWEVQPPVVAEQTAPETWGTQAAGTYPGATDTLPGGAPAPWAEHVQEQPAPEHVQERLVPEYVPEPVRETTPEPVPAPIPAPAAEFVPEPAPEPVIEPMPEPMPEPVTAPVPEAVFVPEQAPPPAPVPDAPIAADLLDVPDVPDALDLPDGPEAFEALGGPPEAPAVPEAPEAPAVLPPMGNDEHPHTSYVLRVNGTDRPVTDAWIGESLLYVLRERLGLAGAKDGCSQGECGACNVQVDGRLVASCLVPAATAAGSEVRTVEGLAEHGEPSDVQRALAKCGVQCGFCIPGMAMTVHDLLEGNHAPTDLETRTALSGNLCRCSGYRGVLDAVREVVAGRVAHPDPQAADGHGAAGGHAGDDAARIPHQIPHPYDGGTA
ncbi:2Fe-2S iron-sulfur cluster-binding protein [Streptomyces laurentii]|uniref:(2Fe-2S)-binding protein n=1 Tax=Streptomyces laurentii TaxID=39478 RepID=UPI0036C3665D